MPKKYKRPPTVAAERASSQAPVAAPVARPNDADDLKVDVEAMVEVASDSDEEAPVMATAAASKASTTRAAAAAFTWDGLQEEEPHPAAKPLSWSFRDAIARIDATERPGATSLRDKIRVVQQQKAKGAVVAAKATAAAADGDEDDEEEGEEQADDDDDDGADELDDDEEEEEEAAAEEDDSENDDADGGDHDAVVAGDDDDDAMDEDEQEEVVPAAPRGPDLADAILAAARPNPHRETFADDDDADPAEYSSFFSADPFASDKLKDKRVKSAAARAGSKRGRADMENAEEGTNPGEMLVSATTEGGVPVSSGSEPSSFSEMTLSRPLLRAITALGFKAPTPIQRRTIPLGLAGHDICGSAVTGSGKTAAYLLPILERLQFKPSRIACTRVLILTPTRELATQVHSMASALAQFCKDIRISLIVGGLSLKQQEAELRTRPDIVVATPGRLLDHIRNTLSVTCDDLEVLVLDEADRLLDMGFEAELHEIVKSCPVGRQTLLFSATMSTRVDTLATLSLRNPIRVIADPLYDMASRLSQEFVRIRAGHEGDREAMLMALLTRSFTGGGVLVFAMQKHTAHRVAILCGLAGLSAAELHGNLTQRQRLAALEDFRDARVDYLIATDLAGRGLDIAGVRVVINMEMPAQLTSYVHRVGRTARAGRAGVAVSLVSENQRTMMKEIVKRAAMNVRSRAIPSDVVSSWRAKLEGWEGDIERVLEAEREERALRRAEMEVDKAHNLVVHADEIAARPPRTWFQSAKEKAETRAASSEAVAAAAEAAASSARGGRGATKGRGKQVEEDPHADTPHRLTRRKKRRLAMAEDMEKEERRIARAERFAEREAEAGAVAAGAERGSKPVVKLDPRITQAKRELESSVKAVKTQHSHAKSVKGAVRETANRLGISTGKAEHMLKKQQLAAKAKKRAAKSPARAAAAPAAAPSAFKTEAKSAAVAMRAATPSGAVKPTHKPGKKSFKSNSRFKRR